MRIEVTAAAEPSPAWIRSAGECLRAQSPTSLPRAHHGAHLREFEVGAVESLEPRVRKGLCLVEQGPGRARRDPGVVQPFLVAPARGVVREGGESTRGARGEGYAWEAPHSPCADRDVHGPLALRHDPRGDGQRRFERVHVARQHSVDAVAQQERLKRPAHAISVATVYRAGVIERRVQGDDQEGRGRAIDAARQLLLQPGHLGRRERRARQAATVDTQDDDVKGAAAVGAVEARQGGLALVPARGPGVPLCGHTGEL